jgi:hypothetical protein
MSIDLWHPTARGVVAQRVKESNNFGYNALTHEYGDLMKMGVIVPTKVERRKPSDSLLSACDAPVG